MAGPFNIAIKAVLKQLGKGSARAVPEDIMSGTIRRIKQEASLPETPSRVFGKDPERYTGPHSDFKRKEGLEAIEEVDVKSFQDKYFRGDDKTRYRSKDLEKKTRELDEGLITLDDFKKARDEIKPLKTYGTVPPLNKQVDEAGELIAPNKFDPIEIVGPIGKTRVDKSGIIGFNKFIKEGERSTSRFDIDAYNHYDRYIPVIETLVDKVSKATGKITKRFAKKGYSPTAVLTDVNFNYNPKKAFSIAKGETKAPFATMEGNWKNLTPEEAHRYAKEKVGTEGWTEVGFDPAARQSFYNRATGEPVFKADEVIQVGAMVLARGLKKATPKQLEKLKITTKAGKEITYKQGGQVSEGLSSIVSRAKGGKTKRKKKDKDFYADFDRKGKPTPELSNRIAISRLMEDLEWERIPKEVKRKRREEAEQWEDMKFIQEAMKEDKKGTQMFMPNQDLYKNPIFKDVVTKRKDGGGLSGINKSININGQPHSLAWINPGEASALKAMGGSGKKGPMGIPSYQTDEDYSWDWGDTGGYDYGAGKTEADIAADPGGVDTGYSEEEIRDYALSIAPPGTTPFQARRNLGPIGTAQAKAEHHDTLTDMRKGILGLYGDRMTRGEALEGAKRSAFTAWRNSIGKYSRDTAKDYDAWFAAQDPNALIAGYKIGDPVGQAMQSSFDIVNKQLKKKFKTARDDIAVGLDDDEEFEMTREELSELVRDAEIDGLEDFTPYTGLDYPAWMPGGMAGKAIDFLSRTVIGTGTVGGVGVHLHKDGSITAISPEDSPGYDHELHHEPGSEPIKRKRLPPVAKPATLEPEKELTGMEALLASRPKATARKDSNVHLSALLDQIYGEGQGQQLLG